MGICFHLPMPRIVLALSVDKAARDQPKEPHICDAIVNLEPMYEEVGEREYCEMATPTKTGQLEGFSMSACAAYGPVKQK